MAIHDREPFFLRILLELQFHIVANDTWFWLHVLGRSSYVLGSIQPTGTQYSSSQDSAYPRCAPAPPPNPSSRSWIVEKSFFWASWNHLYVLLMIFESLVMASQQVSLNQEHRSQVVSFWQRQLQVKVHNPTVHFICGTSFSSTPIRNFSAVDS